MKYNELFLLRLRIQLFQLLNILSSTVFSNILWTAFYSTNTAVDSKTVERENSSLIHSIKQNLQNVSETERLCRF
jgi:hypothetical protein